jgi:protocatechuate 3,4-dioxygenase beta subunit
MCAVFALAVMVPLGAQDAAAPSLLPPGEAGTPLHVEGRILGPAGPVAGAAMYVYQTDQRGYYSSEVNDDNTKPRLKARFQTGSDGSFAFRTIMPAVYTGRTRHYHVKVQAANKPVAASRWQKVRLFQSSSPGPSSSVNNRARRL